MDLPQFLLDDWLAQKHNAATPVEYDLGSSTGPVWTLRELLSLGGDLEELLEAPISYVNPRGSFALRDGIALLEGCDPEYVQATTGGAEALLLIFSEIAVAGANVVLPRPGFPTNDAMAQAFGLEARHYVLRQESGFRIDADEIRGLIDANTRLVLMNSPHNPTGATLSDSEMEGLHDFCAQRGVQFLSDQVYHPIYHGSSQDRAMRTAARLPHATVLGDFSKALCLSGLRIGWIIEPDAERRRRYLNARSYFTVCGSAMSERLGALALRQREAIYARARKITGENLGRIAAFFADRSDLFRYTPPRGGMTAFPSMADGSDARPLCAHALRQGILLAPGDCFGMPAHFRIGFAASGERFAAALEKLAEAVDGFAQSATVNAAAND
jgi:aspartate/methionine/tyrosine aminotransferase